MEPTTLSAISFSEAVRRQRMIRAPYQDRPVPRELVQQVLLDARKAPSAGFSQGTTFIVLEDTREFFELTLPEGVDPALMQPCPIIVLPLENKAAYLERYSREDKAQWGLQREEAWPVPYWTVDTAFAVMTVLLSVTAHGLGAWFFGIFNGEDELLHRLGVPEDIRPIGAIGMGWPTQTQLASGPNPAITARRREPQDLVRWGRW